MKPLSIWLPLILIVSALLLSELEPSPRPAQEPSEAHTLSHQQSEQQPSPVGVSNLSHAPERADTAGHKNNQGNGTSTVVIVISAVISAIATVLIAWFNLQLVSVTRDLHNATEMATAAAKQSSETAKVALHIDRPFLVPDRFAFADAPLTNLANLFKDETSKNYLIENKLVNDATVPVNFLLKNYGKGPAVIGKIVGRIAVIRSLNEIGIGDFTECEEWVVSRAVFGIDDEEKISSSVLALLGMSNPKAGTLTAEELCAVIDSKAILVVYGQVSYTDLFDGKFSADFFWVYSTFPLLAGAGGVAFRGPKEHNRFT